MPPAKYDKKAKKEATLKKIFELFSKHKQIIAVSLENVGSNQVQQIRR
jgi:ribosomal protein L10